MVSLAAAVHHGFSGKAAEFYPSIKARQKPSFPRYRELAQTRMSEDLTPKNQHPSLLRLFRNRVIAGLFVILPIYITYALLKWLYDLLYSNVLEPIMYGLRRLFGFADVNADPSWHLTLLLSFVALLLVITVIYIAGMFFRSRLHLFVNWILLNVPGVKTIYSAVSKVFDAISSSQQDVNKFKRVVLVPFPHQGMKAPAFVTSECTDVTTGRTILCVYVPTTPVPTSGYMLLIPQEEVVDLNWDLEETLQAIVSGGITVPKQVSYLPYAKQMTPEG